MTIPSIKSLFDACILSTPFYSLATVEDKGVWSCTVWFANDLDYTFYFISVPASRHMVNISKNSEVAFSFYNPNEVKKDNSVGIQVKGEAHILNTPHEIQLAYKTYYGKQFPFTGVDQYGRTVQDFITGNTPWKFVKIVPSEMYYFDTRYFEEKRQPVEFRK